MISETFLNGCFALIFAPKTKKMNESIYGDISECLSFHEKFVVDDVAISVRNKFNLLKKVCDALSQGSTISEIRTSIETSGTGKQFRDFVAATSERALDEKKQMGLIRAVQQMIAWARINKTHKRWRDYEDKVGQANFELLDDIIGEWIDVVKSAFDDVTDYEMRTNLGLVSSLNAPNDNLTPIVEEVKKKYSRHNVIPSGVGELDEEFLFGGFQPSRIYMFGGTSGVGKSILLLNFAIRGALAQHLQGEMAEWGVPPEGPQRLFLYVTLENYVYETWIRLYCALLKKTKKEMLECLHDPSTTPDHISREIAKVLAPCNSSIQIDYFPSNTISPANIAALIKKYSRNPGERAVKAVYIDYLDLLRPDERKEFYRLDLGEITSRLKTTAASLEIPIVTATQLNREAYRKDSNREPGIETISESIQKLFIADFGAVMVKADGGDKELDGEQGIKPVKVVLKVEKNRDGKIGKAHVYLDYLRARFLTKEEYQREYKSAMEI